MKNSIKIITLFLSLSFLLGCTDKNTESVDNIIIPQGEATAKIDGIEVRFPSVSYSCSQENYHGWLAEIHFANPENNTSLAFNVVANPKNPTEKFVVGKYYYIGLNYSELPIYSFGNQTKDLTKTRISYWLNHKEYVSAKSDNDDALGGYIVFTKVEKNLMEGVFNAKTFSVANSSNSIINLSEGKFKIIL